MAMNLGFVGVRVWLAAPAPHAGLALATSLGAFVNAGLLYRGLRRDGGYRPTPGWARLGTQAALASAAMAVALAYAAGPRADWLAWDAARRAATLGGLIAGAAAVYFGVLFAVGVRPRQVWRAGGG